jgi:hypothetical protein
MRTVPRLIIDAFSHAVTEVMLPDDLQMFSVQQLGPELGFERNVRDGTWDYQVVTYVEALARKGKLVIAIQKFLAQEENNPRDEIRKLRQQFAACFTTNDATGKIGLSQEPFNVVSIGPGMPHWAGKISGTPAPDLEWGRQCSQGARPDWWGT